MGKELKVSILLATYNGYKYLDEQIKSILSQDFQNFVLYISDDCSTDNTLSIVREYCEKYPKKIKLLSYKQRYGSSMKNFISLLTKVTSDLYFFCDQDDVWTPDHISSMLFQYFQFSDIEKTKPILLHSDLFITDENLNIISNSYFSYSKMQRVPKNKFFYFLQNNVTGCVMMINESLKKIAFQTNTNILFESILIPMHDHYLAFIAFKFGKILFIDKKLEYYRQHKNNVVGAKKVSSLKYIANKIIKPDIKWIHTSIFFAKLCLDNYSANISYNEKKLLEDYLRIYNRSILFKVFFVVKNNFLKDTFFRKILQIYSLFFRF